MKKLILIAMLVPVAGWVSITQVRYKMTKVYSAQQISPEVVSWIEKTATGKDLSDIHAICDFSNQIISKHLSYSYNASVRNPNLAWKIRDVNCLGYASLQTAVINYLIRKAKLSAWHAEQNSCKVYCLGIWTRGYHSYTAVFNRKTHEKLIPDACMYDLIKVGYYKEI